MSIQTVEHDQASDFEPNKGKIPLKDGFQIAETHLLGIEFRLKNLQKENTLAFELLVKCSRDSSFVPKLEYAAALEASGFAKVETRDESWGDAINEFKIPKAVRHVVNSAIGGVLKRGKPLKIENPRMDLGS